MSADDDLKRVGAVLAGAFVPAARIGVFDAQPPKDAPQLGLQLARLAGVPIATPQPVKPTPPEKPEPATDADNERKAREAFEARQEAREKEAEEKAREKRQRKLEDMLARTFAPKKSKKGKRK